MVAPKNRRLSGGHWVGWIKSYAPTSEEVKDLEMMFQKKVTEFKNALEAAGANVDVTHTFRSEQAAYLWHWSWKIAQKKAQPKDAKPYSGSSPKPDIEWDHGNLAASIKGAEEMVKGFKLSTPTSLKNKSYLPPALTTRHLGGFAVDMDITWTGTIKVMMKDGPELPVAYGPVRTNKDLHKVGASYGVHKLVNGRDDVHWSVDGR